MKEGPPLGIGGPRRRVSIAGVVFTPARGVIHPSFPLRGRWERAVKSGKQTPSSRLSLFTSRHMKRAYANLSSTAPANVELAQGLDKHLVMLSLAHQRAHSSAPNPHCEFNSEPSPVRIRHGFHPEQSAAPWPCGSRTRVTKFSNFRGYRFFSKISTECPNAPVLRQNHPMALSPGEAVPPGIRLPCRLAHTSRGPPGVAAECPPERVLLPLCGIAPASRLCEDVRLEAKSPALEGEEMREALHADSRRQPERRPPFRSSRPRRACPAPVRRAFRG